MIAMPQRYLKIKRNLIKSGKSEEVAERIAAATYNKQRKPGEKPVTRGMHSSKKK